ncbi:MAG: cupin domain-containing protein [Ilumatobacter sp.]|uniref:cupin domain-containing protein n=1 Tax=Ilumatobacter sp. TaxID=1967498 RepID=UPI00262CBB07|nr:cupin domain-containing protein [Ilumatobacter sp.]MDJ0767231.1 cupin domain-containing protein [Ilumatobacter sp.]
MTAITMQIPTVLTAGSIEALPTEELGGQHGIEHRMLWHDGTSRAGVLTLAPGCSMPAHTHEASHHHMWVLDGDAELLGRRLGPGSYVHIPAGVEHDIATVDGCSVYYLYLVQPEAIRTD